MRHRVNWLFMVVAIAAIPGCKKHKPEPTCRETLKVTERNGQRVLQAVNGLYLREDFPVSGCKSQSDSEDPYQRQFVDGGLVQLFWLNHKIINGHEHKALQRAGKFSDSDTPYAIVEIEIYFPQPKELNITNLRSKDWQFRASTSHLRYPIDLLPYYFTKTPTEPVDSKKLTFDGGQHWAVPGSLEPATSQPYVVYCTLNLPPRVVDAKATESLESLFQRLIRSNAPEKENIGNTCRGRIQADNGKSIFARIDIPGNSVADIDKIFQATSKHLSELIVD